MAWTDERRAEAKRMWLDGVSASVIARRLGHGLTRNAVIGLAYRAGLKREEAAPVRTVRALAPPRVKADKPPPALPKPAKALNAPPVKPSGPNPLDRKSGAAPDLAPDEPKHAPPKLRVIETDAVHRTMLDPLFRGCRWPVSGEGADTLFCCATQVPKRPYCLAHEAIAHVALKPGRPRTGNELMRSVRRYT